MLKKIPWFAVAIGALNLALQLGGYQNATLARLLWVVFAFAIIQWLVRHENTREKWDKCKRWARGVSRMHSFVVFVLAGAGIGTACGMLLWLIISASPATPSPKPEGQPSVPAPSTRGASVSIPGPTPKPTAEMTTGHIAKPDNKPTATDRKS